jgi:hypothetical protein
VCDHDIFANNTLGNSIGIFPTRANVFLLAGVVPTEAYFINNLILQDGVLPISNNIANNGFTWSNNLWSKIPGSHYQGINDIVGEPLLTKSPDYANPLYYQLLSTSPAIGTGISLASVVKDYFEKLRSSIPSIGADEYISTFHFPGDLEEIFYPNKKYPVIVDGIEMFEPRRKFGIN